MNKISINNIGVINKCLSFILSCILIFLIAILSLTMYFNVILDSMPINILCYLFKDSNGNKITIVLLLFSVIITICCGIMELTSPFKVYNIKPQRKNNIKDSFMQKLNIFWENKSKTRQNPNNYILIKAIIIPLIALIIFLLWFVALLGRDNAKKL